MSFLKSASSSGASRGPRSSALALLATLALVTGVAPRADASLAEGQRLLAEAAEATGADEQRLAKQALAHLALLASRESANCEIVILTTEAALRARTLDAVPQLIGDLHSSGCDPAAVQQLTGWYLEFNDEGVRRGPGAPLAQAQASYRDAATMLLDAPTPRPELARGALASAATLAGIRAAWDECVALVDEGLAVEAELERRAVLGAQRLACRAPLIGEGSALDELSELLAENVLIKSARLRQKQVMGRIARGRDEPEVLAAHATYALIAATPERIEIAHRDLLDALALDDDLPEAWFVLGRVHEQRGRLDEAVVAYRRQLGVDPGLADDDEETPSQLPATRLAINNLAHALVEIEADDSELRDALTLLEAELARTPDEAAMHATRADVLDALGRGDDAERARERAREIDPTAVD